MRIMYRSAAAAIVATAVFSTTGTVAASASTVTSTQWNGYVTSANIRSDTSVAALWVVPQLTCSTVLPAAASQWVGLGGVNYKGSPTDILVQVGIVSQCSGGLHPTVSDKLFDEVVPPDSSPVYVGQTAVTSDDVYAEVDYLGGTKFALTASEAGATIAYHHWYCNKTITVSGENHKPRTAEWIVEAGNGDLARFGTVPFSDCWYKGAGDPDGNLVSQADVNKYYTGTLLGPETSVSSISGGAFTVKYIRTVVTGGLSH